MAIPKINFEIDKCNKKSETAQQIYISKFNEIRQKNRGYKPIYTDGSKTQDAVAAAAVRVDTKITKAFNKNISIFTAEVRALEMALLDIQTDRDKNHIILSDSKSALQALEDLWSPNPEVRRVLELHSRIRKTKDIIFCWVPSHVGIRGNEAADTAAKEALTSPISSSMVPATDWLPKVSKYVGKTRKKQWDDVGQNKLKEIVPDLTDH